MPNLKDKIKENAELFTTCIYIAFAIAITQVISSSIEKYFVNNPNPLSAYIMFIVIVLMYSLVLFVLVRISKTLRSFLLRMFGVPTELKSTEEKTIEKPTVNNQPKKLVIETSDVYFMLVPSILGVISFIISLYAFSGLFSKIETIQTVNADVINGILAISGIIFAFQAFFVKRPKKIIRRFFFTVIFLIEVTTLAYIGLSYIGDVFNDIFPSIGTFFFVFFSLIFTLVNTAFFIVYDLFFPNQEEAKRENASE